MKWISYGSYLLCLLTTLAIQPAIAQVPVTISSPSPAIASNYNVGNSNPFTYTITNNVPNKSFPITVNGLSGPVSRTTVAGDCGNNIPIGPSTCKLGITIAPQAGNAGNSFNQIFSVNYQGRIPLTSHITFSVAALSVTGVLTAVGLVSGTNFPLLADSTDGGNIWAVKTVTGIPTTGEFYQASCTGSGSTAICTAVGQDYSGIQPPLLVISTDGGNNWAVKSVTGLPTRGYFLGTSCVGSGLTAICTAVGEDFTGSTPTLLAVSTDGGSNWAVKSVAGVPINGVFSAASCTGSGSTAICTAAGQDHTGSQPPLLAVSVDGANTWTVKSITGLPTNGSFAAASCTGSGSTAICTAAGQDLTGSQPPLLAVSTDGGNTWAVKTVPGIPVTGLYTAASCTGTGSTAVCTAAGRSAGGSPSPLLAVSTDGGNTWAVKSVTGIPISGYFFGTACTGSGSTAICTAAGADTTISSSPLVAVSTNGGNTWAVKSITGAPANGYFYSTSCTGTLSTAVCTAAGGDNTGTSPPLLVISADGGNTWSVKSVSGLPASGYFGATGATGGT